MDSETRDIKGGAKMIIKVKDIKPNPFRRMDKYPINREKVKSLKTSISKTSFWDNLLAREKDGKNEIAYGHHRLIALQELGVKTVDIPIREFDDGMMIVIMANENLDDWRTTPSVYAETVSVAKKYLDGELAKCDSWDMANKNISHLFNNAKSFSNTKRDGVGQTTLLKFLGGNWKQWIIQDALNTLKSINENEVSEKAIDELPSVRHSSAFKTEVKKYKIPPSEQVGLAKEIKKDGAGKRAVKSYVKEHARITHRIPKPVKEPTKREEPPKIDVFAGGLDTLGENFDSQLFKLVGSFQYIESNFIKESLKSTLNAIYKKIEQIKKEY